MLPKSRNLGVMCAAGLAITALVAIASTTYSGSKLVYFLFSAIFWLMLLSAFDRRTHYSHFFLSVALWLGFWGKITAHLLLSYPYLEPTGGFKESPESWDGVLWVAIAASAGVIFGRILVSLMGMKYSRIIHRDTADVVPQWYGSIRLWVWAVALAVIGGVAALNLILGIQQIGLVPRTILPWPLNALIAWQVSIGSALLLTVLLWWEISLKKSIAISIYALLIEAVISTTALLSRGVYIFHTIPQFLSLFENRKLLVGMSKIRALALFFAFTVLMVMSISGVTTFRAYMYPHAGGFTTEEQRRITRLEVLQGGIARVKRLILNGEPQEGHLLDLLGEKAELERQNKLVRLEVLDGGIARVKKLILQGDRQEGHLQDLLAEKAQLEKPVPEGELQAKFFREWLVEKAQLERMALKGGPEGQLFRDWMDEKIPLEKALLGMHANGNSEANRDREPTAIVKEPVALPTPASINLPSNPDGLFNSKNKLVKELYYQIGAGAFSRILTLVVDRWIGLEGVMAVYSYPKKNSKLLIDAVKEKREIGKTTKFQEISNSPYQWVDAKNWQFASLPGAAAFFYFSGSLWVVFLGMAFFAVVLQLIEQLAFFLTSNPLFCAMFGLTLANTVTQFGITPRQDIPYYSMIFGFVVLISIVQSNWAYAIFGKHGSRQSARA